MAKYRILRNIAQEIGYTQKYILQTDMWQRCAEMFKYRFLFIKHWRMKNFVLMNLTTFSK